MKSMQKWYRDNPFTTHKEVLSNWLARQTVNLVSLERVGSSPTTSTSTA